MEEFNRILIGTDGSEHADLALGKAFSLARLLGKPLLAIYVVDPAHFHGFPAEGLLHDMTQALQDEARAVLKRVTMRGEVEGVAVQTRVVEGRPSEELCQAAAVDDLIVVATHGRRGLGRILLGSVAENVVRHAPCPVLVVRDPKRRRRVSSQDSGPPH